MPTEFGLEQNYPNPFNPSTTINYSLPRSGFVSMKIYDVLGKEIKTLISETKIAGNYSIKFDGVNLPSGIYFYQMKTSEYMRTKKMILLK
ncbi:MAG: T9SS type A sorting domain-containing protein [Bacteroidetes bacterium]|nr:T9SS type A sorting domain-containing protein [Bacteroidota bacterium]